MRAHGEQPVDAEHTAQLDSRPEVLHHSKANKREVYFREWKQELLEAHPHTPLYVRRN